MRNNINITMHKRSLDVVIFINNKYTKWYFSIIEKRKKNNIINGYKEKHHIIPKCIGGSDEKENLIFLTAKEHFICHLLLTKMNPSNKLKYALVGMSIINQKQQRYKIGSKIYDYVKKCNSQATSERLIGSEGYWKGKSKPHSIDAKLKIGKKNKGRVYYYNPNTMNVIALSDKDEIPLNYIKGNPKADTSEFNGLRKSTYYYNPKTGEEKRLMECPDNWKKGRVFKYITDGNTSKLINVILEQIPKGWYFGRTMDWKRNKNKI